jgi:multimeric flavodoxin WrbA
MSHSKRLLLVYNSQSGRTAQLAFAAATAVAVLDHTELRVRRASDATTQDIAWSDALLLGAAETAGLPAGGFKEFMDRILYPCQEAELLRPYALFISAGNDGTQAARGICRQLSAIPWRRIAPVLVLRGEVDSTLEEPLQELAATLAEGLSLGIY